MERGTAELTDAEVVLGYRDRLKEARLLEARLQEDEAAGAPLGLELKEERQALRTLQAQLQRFEAALNRVKSPRERLILRGYYGNGLTDAALGEALEMSTRRVNSLRHQAVAALKGASGAV